MNTTVKTEEQKLPQLIKMSDTYRLIVPSKVEEKIRYLLRKYPSTEWSGVLFTTHEGTFEDKNLVITCQDIYPMDLGNAVHTDFNMSEDVAAYIADNLELFNCDCQLIHSHHGMATTFSGTDINTLKEEGNERNCFVSLIVNNAGVYNAAITRKMQTKTEVVTKSLGTSYEFFGDGEIRTDEDPMSESTQIIDKEVIQYFMLDVEREEVANPLSYLDERFIEIEKKKQETKTNVWKSPCFSQPTPKPTAWKGIEDNDDFYGWLHRAADQKKPEPKKPEPKEATLFTEEEMKEMEVPVNFTLDAKAVHEAVVHMITCSLILNAEKFDLKQWIVKHMENMYKKIFEEKETMSGYPVFDNWMDFIIDYTISTFEVPEEVYINNPEIDVDEFNRSVAQAMYDELAQYKGINTYIDDYLGKLDNYIYY